MQTKESKELKLRQLIVTGSLWRVILYITYPLALYGLFNHLYGFIDMVLVAHIGNTEIASVAIFSEIQSLITAFGAGIASGGAVIVARHIGANRMEEAKKNASTVFFLAVYVSVFIILLLVPTAEQFLKLLGTPKDVIDTGLGYFIVQIFTTGFVTINSVFIGLEKAKANTRKILYLNIIVMSIKLLLSVVFVYGFGLGILYVSIATMIAQGVLTIIAFMILFNKNNAFRINFSEIRLKKQYVIPILTLSLPIFFGRFIFSFGRVLMNAMAAFYGTMVVSAFSIAQKIGGAGASLALVFDEALPTVISQNLGAKRIDRAKKAYPIALAFGMSLGIFTILYAHLLKGYIIPFITHRDSSEAFLKIVVDLFNYEIFSKLTGAIIAITLSMFYGFRHTKVTMGVNIARLFIFRVPVLLLFQQVFGIGYIAIGYTMFISNTSTAILALLLAGIFYHKLHSNPTLEANYI